MNHKIKLAAGLTAGTALLSGCTLGEAPPTDVDAADVLATTGLFDTRTAGRWIRPA